MMLMKNRLVMRLANEWQERKWAVLTVLAALGLFVLILTNRSFPDHYPEKHPLYISGKNIEREAHDPAQLRVLVGMTVGKKCRERAAALVQKWGTSQFNYYFMAYDDSDWSHLSKVRGVTVTQEPGFKMFHYKKFITPQIITEGRYDYFFLVDCDAGLDAFDPLEYLHIVHTHAIPISQPSVEWGALTDRSSDHRVCRNVPGFHSGRWVNFVECGPMVIFSAEAWICTYDLVMKESEYGSGWGLDYKWCAYARDVCRLRPAVRGPLHTSYDAGRVCAVIDAVTIEHLDEKTAFGLYGNGYQPRVAADVYEEKFPEVESIVNTNCMCACDCGGGTLTSLVNSLVRIVNVFTPWSLLQCECRF